MTGHRTIVRLVSVIGFAATALWLDGAADTGLRPGLVAEALAATPMGDLSPFRTIVVETAALVEAGDMTGAAARIKDLELAWDDAEPSLKPRSPADWHRLDKAIDRTLDALRSTSPDQKTCAQALNDLLVTMDR